MAKGSAYVHEETNDRRDNALLEVNARAISTYSLDDLAALKARLGYGEEWSTWEVPMHWMPKGRGQRDSSRITRATHCVPLDSSEDSESARLMWAEVLRLGLLRSLVPAKFGGVATPSTIVVELRLATRLARALLEKDAEAKSLWASIDDELGLKTLKKAAWRIIRGALTHLYQTGYLPTLALQGSRRNGAVLEVDRRGKSAPETVTQEGKKWQAFPDHFVAECGWRVLWIVRNLGPQILQVLEAVDEAGDPQGQKGPLRGNGLRHARSSRHSNIVRQHTWIGADGGEITEVPFELDITRRESQPLPSASGGFTGVAFSWPPRTYYEVLLLANVLQAAHAFILLLSAGPRSSDVLSYTETCAESLDGGAPRLLGRTFKLAPEDEGRIRDYPAPRIVLQAAEQQAKLARVIKRIATTQTGKQFGDHLWVQVTPIGASKQGSQLNDLNFPLESMVHTIGVKQLLDGTFCHTHRFRKTLARLVALALVNAQMILMDCFGHEDPEMTLLRYILSDKRIHADVLRVQKELVILLATDAIENAETLGGPSGETVRSAKAKALQRLGKSSLDPADVRELAEALTFEGRTWSVVAAGVICALPMGMTGPCAQRQGGRNTAECRSGCGHQILTDYNKSETDDTIAYIVEQLATATCAGNTILEGQWRAQLKVWLYRWSDVFEKWAAHPAIAPWADPWPGSADGSTT